MQSFVTNCRNLVNHHSKDAKKPPQKAPHPPEDEHAEEDESDEELEPTPTPTPVPFLKQREPSAVVIDRAVRLFESIAADESLREKTVQAYGKLKFVILDKTRSTLTEREYFGLLFTFIDAVFNQYDRSTSQHSPVTEGQTDQQKGQRLESLFDQ